MSFLYLQCTHIIFIIYTHNIICFSLTLVNKWLKLHRFWFTALLHTDSFHCWNNIHYQELFLSPTNLAFDLKKKAFFWWFAWLLTCFQKLQTSKSKKYPIYFSFLFYKMYDPIYRDIYKKLRVVYQPNFVVRCSAFKSAFLWFHSWYKG